MTDERVRKFIEQNFTPVALHVRNQAPDYQRWSKRYGVEWTPTILFLDLAGEEHYRTEGFLPADDFMAQLALGLGRIALAGGQHEEAIRRFAAILKRHPDSDSAPEALYWMGVARFKSTNDPTTLKATEAEFQRRYQQSAWAKKASVWAG